MIVFKNKLDMILSPNLPISRSPSLGPEVHQVREREEAKTSQCVALGNAGLLLKSIVTQTPYRRRWPFWKDKIKMVPYGKPHFLSNAIYFNEKYHLFVNSHVQIDIAIRPNVLK